MFKYNEIERQTLTFEEAVKLVRPIKFIEPSDRVKRYLNDFKRNRRINLDILEPINGFCSWCEAVKLPKRKKKYCSESCKDSAFAWCNPNLNHIKGHILIFKQSCACAGCGLSFEDEVRRQVEVTLHWRRDYNARLQGREKPRLISNFSPAVAVDNTGHLMQVDHIKPIHQGGDGLGWHNLQVLCTQCHTTKTINEKRFLNGTKRKK